ncbi:MAG: response regulator, partial [Nitrospira sp.]|nr:response regulator [Nitrospira sp.]
ARVDLTQAQARLHGDLPPGSYAVLTVKDTGTGMDGATLARCFEPFFTTKPVGQGTGLGLSMVYGIVRQSGGHIEVTSRPGQGTTFRLYFPRADLAQETEQASPLAVKPKGGTETILVVEDEPGVRQLILDVLRDQGYTTLEAAHGHEALCLGLEHVGPIHLLLTDMVMPGMTGREVAQQFLRLRPDVKTIYMTGYPQENVQLEEILRPGDAFLQKPFEPDQLLTTVRELLEPHP